MESPVFTAQIKQLKQQKLFYIWTHHAAYGGTAVQVCTHTHSNMCGLYRLSLSDVCVFMSREGSCSALFHPQDALCVSVEVFVPPCVSTPEFLHAAMRPDVVTETVVEVSTEEAEPVEVVTLIKEPRVIERDGRKKKSKSK